jgi:hypothetical protein
MTSVCPEAEKEKCNAKQRLRFTERCTCNSVFSKQYMMGGLSFMSLAVFEVLTPAYHASERRVTLLLNRFSNL